MMRIQPAHFSLLLLVASALGLPFLSYDEVAAQDGDCNWLKTPPPPESRSDLVFWFSDADLVDAQHDLYQMTRLVVNRGNIARKITWPLGRMQIDSLAPGEGALYCTPPLRGRNIATGPLYYARTTENLTTTVYEGYREPSEVMVRQGTPLITSTVFSLFREDGAQPTIRVGFTTTVTSNGDGFEVSYTLFNDGQTDAVFSVQGLPQSVLSQLDGLPLRLGPDQARSATVVSNSMPYIVDLPLLLQDGLIGRVRAVVEIGTFLPTSGWAR